MTREEQIKKQADIYTDDASNYTEWSDDGGWSDTNDIAFRSYENVCFHLGYTNNTMTFKITSMNVMYGEVCRQDWGAEPNKYYFVIKLGEWVN